MDFENPDFKESSTGVQYQRLTPYQQRRKRPSHSFIMTMDPSPPRQPLLLLLSLLLLAISWQHTPNVHAFGVVPPTPRRLQQHQQQHQSQQFRLVLSSSSSSDNNAAAAAAPAVTIVDQVTQQMKISMKAKDTTTLATIRLIRSAFANAAKLGCRLAVTVLRKLAKMRQESIQMFQDGGALDRANAEREELQVIERWLPQLANEEQTTTWVLEAIETVGSVDNVGKIMGALMKLHKNELDGTLTQRIVKEQVAKVKQQQ